MRKWLAAYLDDLFYGLGAVLIILFAYFMLPASALLVAGAFCLHFSYLLGKAQARQ